MKRLAVHLDGTVSTLDKNTNVWRLMGADPKVGVP
jgi:hypothetical protein